jgi:hypothetical protein
MTYNTMPAKKNHDGPPPVPSFSFFVAESSRKKSLVELVVPQMEQKEEAPPVVEDKVVGVAEVRYAFNPRNASEVK